MAAHFLVLTNTLGAMAICTLLYGVLQRHMKSTVLRDMGIGLAFGFGAFITMLQPVVLEAGSQADVRGAFIGMAAAIGGPVAAGIAAALAIAGRLAIGGNGTVVGALSVVATAAGAVAWCRFTSSAPPRPVVKWPVMCVICTVPSALALFTMAGGVSSVSVFLSLVICLVVLAFGRMLEIEQRRWRMERELFGAAFTDPLTDLPNRRALENHVRKLERENATGILLLLIDIDHFKQINDTHGHETGDAVLRKMGAAVSGMLRKADFAARVGGEEFVLILKARNGEAGQLIADRFHTALRISFGAGQEARVSVGGYFFGREPFRYYEGYRKADQALYASKRRGRDRVTIRGIHESPNSLAA